MVFTFVAILLVSSVLCAGGRVRVYGVLIKTFSASPVVLHVLFALDVDSFPSAPTWALVVICKPVRNAESFFF